MSSTYRVVTPRRPPAKSKSASTSPYARPSLISPSTTFTPGPSHPTSSEVESPSQEVTWALLRRLQRRSVNLTSYDAAKGLHEVPFPCSRDGTPVPDRLFWKVPQTMDFPPLHCFHGLRCTTFKCKKPGIQFDHFVAACRVSRQKSCGFWISITQISRNIDGRLNTRIYKELEPTFDAQLRQAMELSARSLEAELGQSPDRISNSGPPQTSDGNSSPPPSTPGYVLPPLPIPDYADSIVSNDTTVTPSPSRLPTPPASSDNSTAPVEELADSDFEVELEYPLDGTLPCPLLADATSEPDEVMVPAVVGTSDPSAPFNFIPTSRLEDSVAKETATDQLIFRLAAGKAIPFKNLLASFRRCPDCLSLYMDRHRHNHKYECTPRRTKRRDRSYGHAGDMAFDLAAPNGAPVASFCRFFKVCKGCRMVQPMKYYLSHPCDLTTE